MLVTAQMAAHIERPIEHPRSLKTGREQPDRPEDESTAAEREGARGAAVASILLVDDNEEIRSAVSELLEDEGYRVATAVNGKEALDVLKRGPLPRLILLDLMMPVMDGWQFLAVRRADPALSRIPVVILSAFAHSADRVAGVTAILSKPLDPDLLLKLVRSQLTDPDA